MKRAVLQAAGAGFAGAAAAAAGSMLAAATVGPLVVAGGFLVGATSYSLGIHGLRDARLALLLAGGGVWPAALLGAWVAPRTLLAVGLAMAALAALVVPVLPVLARHAAAVAAALAALFVAPPVGLATLAAVAWRERSHPADWILTAAALVVALLLPTQFVGASHLPRAIFLVAAELLAVLFRDRLAHARAGGRTRRVGVRAAALVPAVVLAGLLATRPITSTDAFWAALGTGIAGVLMGAVVGISVLGLLLLSASTAPAKPVLLGSVLAALLAGLMLPATSLLLLLAPLLVGLAIGAAALRRVLAAPTQKPEGA